MDGAENIDHILDNMFVQRAPAYQPTTGLPATRKSSSPGPTEQQKSSAEYNSSSTTTPGDQTAYSVDTAEVKQTIQVNEINNASLGMEKMHITSAKTEIYGDVEAVSTFSKICILQVVRRKYKLRFIYFSLASYLLALAFDCRF